MVIDGAPALLGPTMNARREHCDMSLRFIETSGCLPMGGHPTIGSIPCTLEAGLVEPKQAGTVVVDVPSIEGRAWITGRGVHDVADSGPYAQGLRSEEFVK
jgi:proline racemase